MSSKNSSHRRNTLAARRRQLMESLEPRQLLTVFNPANSAALTTAINSAQLGDTITLNAGTTYTGGFVLPNKLTGTGWITIQSSNLASLPAEGVRVGPGNAADMPNIISPGNNVPDISTQAGAHHFKFVGIEFIGYIADKADGSAQTHTTIMELGNDTQTTIAQVPHHIIVDRCYFHPDVYTRQVRRAIALHAAYVDVTNSYIEEIHEGSDSNAIIGWNGTGPYNIINNHLEGAGENILFGGADNHLPTVDTQVVIRGNHVVKPLYWLNGFYKDDPTKPYPNNYWTDANHVPGNLVFKTNFKNVNAPTVKNLLELKEGSHFVVEDNIFENAWVSGQAGIAILFKLGDYAPSSNNGVHYNVDEDIIFRHNIVRHAAGGITFQGRDYAASNPSDPGGLVRRFKIENNLWDDIGSRDGSGNAIWGGVSPFSYLVHGPKDVEFRHNTISLASYTPLELDDNLTTWSSPNFVYTDNVVNVNDYGIRGSSGSGDNGIKFYVPDSLIKGNVFLDNKNVSPAGNYDNVTPASWPNNKYAPTRVRFVNFWEPQKLAPFVNAAGGNYRLTNPNKYINGTTSTDTLDGNIQVTARTTDGTAPGVNFDILDGALQGAISGSWPFAYVSGSRLFIHFDGSATPISLTISGSNYVVSKTGQTPLTVAMAGITGIHVVDTSGDDTLQVSGGVSPALLVPTNTPSNDLIQLSGGNYSFGSDLSIAGQYAGWQVANWGIYVAGGATATFTATSVLTPNSNQRLRSLSVDGTATLAAGSGLVLTVTDLAVAGKLNLNDNDLIWDYSAGSPIGAWTGGNVYDGLTGLIAKGRNGGSWNGNGLITTQSNAAPPTSMTTLGVAEASNVLNYNGGQSATFSGQTVDQTAVLVKYTYVPDANLSGRVDGDDFFRLDTGFQGGPSSYWNGDFNFDGRRDADDYFLIDSKIAKQGAPL